MSKFVLITEPDEKAGGQAQFLGDKHRNESIY